MLQPLPGRRLRLLRRIHVAHDESHERGEPVAMVDFAVAPLQRNKSDRRVEIVTIGVELVEQIHEAVFRRRAFGPEITLHIGVARIEGFGDLLWREETGDLMRTADETAAD